MKKTALQIIAITLITFSLSYLADKMMNLWLLKIAFPESLALEDFHWEDFVFKLREDQQLEEKVVLVNIGSVGRRGIASVINEVNKQHPRVVGLLVLLNCGGGPRDTTNCPQLKDTLGNRMLSDAIYNSNVMVMDAVLRSTKVEGDPQENDLDSIELSDPAFMPRSHYGFANLPMGTFHDIRESRTFFPQAKVRGKTINSFAFEIVHQYDSTLTGRLLKRGDEEEIINFRGNETPYRYDLGSRVVTKETHFLSIPLDVLLSHQVAEGTFTDKIVLIGFLGDYLDDPSYEDKFYTPLNPTFAGRTNPDMLGLVVHANIVSMILNSDYVNQLADFWENVLLVLIVVANVYWFIKLIRRNSVWYDSLCFIIPVIQIIVISWIRIELLNEFNFRLDLQNVIYLVAFVSFATNMYFGPLAPIGNFLRRIFTT
jgi:CHASE2 domain-containing sensor protein